MRDDADTADGTIDLSDGTWEDLGPDGRWHPSSADRVRAAVVLAVFFVFLGCVVVLASQGDTLAEESAVPSTTTPATTTTTSASTTTVAVTAVGEVPGSAECREDDRAGAAMRTRGEVIVLVLNATSQAGLAGTTTEDLVDLGYDSVEPDNHPRIETTVVHYREGFCAEAERLAGDLGFPDAEVSLVPRNLPAVVGRANLVAVVGADAADEPDPPPAVPTSEGGGGEG